MRKRSIKWMEKSIRIIGLESKLQEDLVKAEDLSQMINADTAANWGIGNFFVKVGKITVQNTEIEETGNFNDNFKKETQIIQLIILLFFRQRSL